MGASRGVYQGVDTMRAEESQALWDIKQGKKRHDKRTQEQLDKRALFGSVSNIAESFLPPGYKQIADVGSKQLEQKLFEMPEYEDEEGSSFWGSKEISAFEEEDEAFRKDADTSLLEGIIGGVGDYVSSGGDFGVGGTDMPQAHGEFSPELMSQFMKNGGRVPKYKKGGGLFKGFGKKKKDKVPERDEALVALDAILSREYEMKEGKHEYPYGYNVARDEAYSNGRTTSRTIAKFMTPEGERFYPGEETSLSSSLASSMSMMDAASRAYHSPADSITTDQLAKFKELGLFEQGGQVPKYYGGGSVSGSPTIANYFSQQGKTLGGSDTQSLAEKLGRI